MVNKEAERLWRRPAGSNASVLTKGMNPEDRLAGNARVTTHRATH